MEASASSDDTQVADALRVQSYEQITNRYRKRELFDQDAPTARGVQIDRSGIMRIIPHRPPFLLIDSVNAIDLERQVIRGARKIDPKDPVFQGHFPNYPVYPGVLHIEMIGQMGLCLQYFARERTFAVADNATAANIRLVKVEGATFQYEVLPGDEVSVEVKHLEADEYLVRWVGQIAKGTKVCTVAIGQIYLA